MAEELVITPGGPRPKSLVHRIAPGTVLDGSGGRLRNLGPSGEVLADFGVMPVLPRDVAQPRAAAPGGWITDARWSRPAAPVTSFSTTWRVPPEPATQSGQTIFLFNGMQDPAGHWILQPVLQWGKSAIGGGNYWSIQSWWVEGNPLSPGIRRQGGRAFSTPVPVQVNPGDVLTGTMSLSNYFGDIFSYYCEFEGVAGTSLSITSYQELPVCYETLECYNITRCSDYPAGDRTRMESIVITTQETANPVVVDWSVKNWVTDCGQNTVIVSNSSTNGEVDLYYARAVAHPTLIASTGQDGLTSIGCGVSLNDSGSVAFSGSTLKSQGIFVVDGTYSSDGSLVRNINPVFSSSPATRAFGDYVQINNAGKVLAQDQEVGAPPRTSVRAWDSHITDAFDLIATGGVPSDKFNAVMYPASIKNFAQAIGGGDVTFPALIGANYYLATPVQFVPANTLFNDVLISGNPRPRISDNGRIVVRAGDQPSSPIWVYGYDLTSAPPEDVAYMGGASPCFSAVGNSPGISADGQIVAFYGDLTQAGASQWGLTAGPGIFASIRVGSQWTIHRVAGIGGVAPAGFVPDALVGVNSVRMFTYLGTDAAGNKGLYMTRLSFFSVSPPNPVFGPVAEPMLLAAVGSSLVLADGSSLNVLKDVDIYDSPNIHGDVAFWVKTIDGLKAVALMPRGSGSDYRDPVHATYINAYDAGNASAPFPDGLPEAFSDNQRGGDACGAAALTMLLNAMQYAAGVDTANRQDLVGVYWETADQPVADPAPGPGGNNFNWIKGRNLARNIGYQNAKYLNGGKAAIDAQLANNVAVVASTRFGLGPNWSKGHCVLLLSRTPADPATGSEGFYVVDDPAGYVAQTPAGGYGYYGRGQCGEHVIYPESLVAKALVYPDGTPRYALVLDPVPGTDPDVMLVIGRFDGPGPQPFQLWLQDASGRQAGWLPGGQQVGDIPGSDAAISPVVASDPSTVPDAPPDEGSWPYAVSVVSPEDGLQVFVSGNVQADFSLEALSFTAGGVIRSVTSGTVAAGETQEVTLAAPALYTLTLSAGAGGSVTASPAPGPYPDGTQVTVTAAPDTDYVFGGWSIDGTPGYLAQPLALFMDADHTVTAGFTAATLQSITVSPASPAVTAGAAQKFLASGTYSDASTADLTATAAWSASDTTVATISPAVPGLASALQDGTVTISAAQAGITGTATLTVAAPPVLQAIAVSPVNPAIAAGKAFQFTATGTLSDGSTQDLTGTASWSSSAAAIATIGTTGIVTAGEPGTATITATAAAVSGSTSITVITVPVLTAIQVVPVAAGIQQFRAIGTYSDGSSYDLTASAAWSTSDPAVATISPAGVATEVKAGSVTIGAAAAGISGSASLEVTPPVLLTIVVSPVNPGITAGTAVQLTATGTRSDGTTQDLTATAGWSSSNPATATVGATGIANGGLQPGVTAVTAAAGGISGSTSLTVAAAPALQAIAVSPARPVIAAGGGQAFTATGLYADGSTRDLTQAATWSSGTAAVATIEGPGVASGATGGITQITAAAEGFTGAASLVVTAVPTLRSIAVTPAAPSVPVGETIQFTAAGTNTDGSSQDITGTVTWASTEPGIAALSPGGLATPAAQGTTSITATDGAVSGTASLTVPPPVTSVTWTGQVSDSWQDAGNWSGDQVPGPSHDVVIAGPAGLVVTYTGATSSIHSLSCQNDLSLVGGSLTLGASSVIVGALTMSVGAELAYGADVLVSGLFTCAYGQLSGPGTLTAGLGLALSGESLLITGGTLVNTGTATWSSGNITLEQDAAIINGPGALFDVQFDPAFLTYQGTEVAVFTNNGTFRKSAGTGTVSLTAITFNNAGRIELDSGEVSFEPNPALPGSLGIWTGTVTGADGTTLTFAGPHDLRESSSLTVPTVVFNGGPVSIGGQYDVAVSTSTTTASPAVSFTGSATVVSVGAVSIDSGTISFGTGTPVTLPSLTLSTGGELAGPDDLLVSGMLTVTSGTLSGPGTMTASSGLTISAAGGQLQVSGCALVNTGYATWTGGNISLGPGGTIENRFGATFEVLIDQFAQLNAFIVNTAGPGPAAFTNAGTFHASSVAGTGTVRVQSAALDNTGTIQLDGGTLFLQPTQGRPAVWTGTFTGDPGSTLVLAGPHDLQASSSVTGPAVQFASPFGPVTIAGYYDVAVSTSTTTESPAVYFTAGAALRSTGAVSIDSGTISFSTGTAVVLPSLTLAAGGGLAGTDQVTVSGPFTSTGGQLSGPGTVIADVGLSISGNEEFLISGCTLVNTGAATWSGGAINADNGAVLANAATGTFEVTCDGLFYWCGLGPDGCSPVGRQPLFQNAGTFVKSAGSGVTDFRGFPDLGGMDVSFVNTGTVEVRTGQVAFGRTYTQTAGSLLLTGGNISALGTLDIQAGALSGAGTVTANVQNAAALGLGADIGTLTVAGDYTQLPAGQLTIRLGGLMAGTQYDQFAVSGAAQLAGTLALTLASGFTPASGDAFIVLTYGSETGSLAIVGGGPSYTAGYGPAALVITAS
jgi:hypothetical protein